MPGNFKKDDLRIIKTLSSLSSSLVKLLNHRNFNRLTVNDLCEEARISRPTFYTHFNDKYDMLKYWLELEVEKIIESSGDLDDMAKNITKFLACHSKLVTNLVENANHETTELLCNTMATLLRIPYAVDGQDAPHTKYIALSVFCAGGMVNLLSWQVKSKFSTESYEAIAYLFGVITQMLKQENQLRLKWEGVQTP